MKKTLLFPVLMLLCGIALSQDMLIHKTGGSVVTVKLSNIDSITFTSDSGNTSMTVTDVDGNKYHTVAIGNQVWMKENLKTTRYNDGTVIPLVTDNKVWSSLTTPAYCWYNNDTVYKNNGYGALYNWYSVNTGKMCPPGWHVPVDKEWCMLENFAEHGTDSLCNIIGWRGINTGGKLKEAGTSHWSSPNSGADNQSGFTALPTGFRYDYGTFIYVGSSGGFWTATDNSNTTALYRYMSYNNPKEERYSNSKNYGFSIRCVKD